MQQAMEQYFRAERAEAIVFLMVGLCALVMAVYWWVSGSASAYRGAGVSLALAGVIQIVVGATIFFRTPADVQRMRQTIEGHHTVGFTSEQTRMKQVISSFGWYRWIEIVLLILGILVALISVRGGGWYGVGVGLAAQAGTMLLLDFFAERRAHEYLRVLTAAS